MASVMTGNLEQHFECSVCFENFSNPRVLSCLHTFCERCLGRLVEHEGELKWLVKCPECRKHTEVPDGQVQNLKANFFINNLMSSVELHKEKQNISCDDCATQDPPVVRCVTCCQFLCDFCSQAHRRRNQTKCHKLMNLEELKSCGPSALSKPAICKIHESEPVKLYCESCETTICRDCTMIDHRDHKYQFVKDVYKKEKAAVNQRLGETKAKQSELEDALKGVVEMKTRVQRAGERVAQQINTSVDTLIEKLNDRRNDLLQQAGEIEQGKLKGLHVQQEELELALSTVTSSVVFTEKALRDGSQVEVLSMKKQMSDRLREVKTGKWQLHPCTGDFICYKVKPVNIDVINGLGEVEADRTSSERFIVNTEAPMVKIGTKMTIFANDQHEQQIKHGSDDVSVKTKSPSVRNGTQIVNITEIDDGIYRASNIPQVPGENQASIKRKDSEKKNIKQSPFVRNVKGGTSAEMSTLEMEVGEVGVIYNTLVNQSRDFTVVTKDSNGEQIREADDVISVEIRKTNSRSFEVIPVQNLQNGRYKFCYKPSCTGNYQVRVKVNGDDIQGSPFTWGVEQWHLKAKGNTNKYLKFSQGNMTVSYIGDHGRVAGSCGFSTGSCHSWKVKVVSGRIYQVGVSDCVLPQENSWYWNNGARQHICNGGCPRSKKPSNITEFTPGDICVMFLNRKSNQLTVHHLPSAQTDTWANVNVPNSNLSPHYYLDGLFEITLIS